MKTNDKNSFITAVQILIALLALALGFLFLLRMTGFSHSPEDMKRQLANAEKQIAIMKDNQEKLTKSIDDRKALVLQAERTQQELKDLTKGLDELARGGDKDAQEIIREFGLKVPDNRPGGATITLEKQELFTAPGGGRTAGRPRDNSIQSELLRKLTVLQELNQTALLQQQEFTRQAEIINAAAQVAQKLGPSVLRAMRDRAAKGNAKLRDLVRPKMSYTHSEDYRHLEKAKQGSEPPPAPKPGITPQPRTNATK